MLVDQSFLLPTWDYIDHALALWKVTGFQRLHICTSTRTLSPLRKTSEVVPTKLSQGSHYVHRAFLLSMQGRQPFSPILLLSSLLLPPVNQPTCSLHLPVVPNPPLT